MATRCYYIDSLDPYFNLATEEYLLKNIHDDIFMLWRDESSIVVGKHQNALAEINHSYVKEKNLKVARRLSGGGTVFHDLGNINFTFIRKIENIEKLNYDIFLDDVKTALKALGLNVYNSHRDDLMIDNFKISGNAQHVQKNKVLHHGTLLFNSELKSLRDALAVNLERFEHKAVQSNRSTVANIIDFLQKPMSSTEFAQYMFNALSQLMPNPIFSKITSCDKLQIQQLRREKYRNWDWIYGYSPKYVYRNKDKESGFEFQFNIQKGRVVNSQWLYFSIDLAGKMNEALDGVRHEYDEFFRELKKIRPQINEELLKYNLDFNSLLKMMF